MVDGNVADQRDVAKEISGIRNDLDIRYTTSTMLLGSDVDLMLHFFLDPKGGIQVSRKLGPSAVPEPYRPLPVAIIEDNVPRSVATRALSEINAGCGSIPDAGQTQAQVPSGAGQDTSSGQRAGGQATGSQAEPVTVVLEPTFVIQMPEGTEGKSNGEPVEEPEKVVSQKVYLGTAGWSIGVPAFAIGAGSFIAAAVLNEQAEDEEGKSRADKYKYATALFGVGIGSAAALAVGVGFGIAAWRQKIRADGHASVFPYVAPGKRGVQFGISVHF